MKANAKALAFICLRRFWWGFRNRFYTLFYTTPAGPPKVGQVCCYRYSQPEKPHGEYSKPTFWLRIIAILAKKAPKDARSIEGPDAPPDRYLGTLWHPLQHAVRVV
jgi:hypothetical protein